MYSSQVGSSHYKNSYDSLERFVSYYNQKNIVCSLVEKISTSLKEVTILEIGKGNGFLSEYLKLQGLKIKTLDNTKDLSPDYVGNITDGEHLPQDKFDLVCCFEVLEHIQFSDVDEALKNLAELSNGYVVMSLPQMRLYSSFWFKIPLFRGYGFTFSVPFPTRHKFDGEHYWELGKRGFGYAKFRSKVSQYFTIEREFTHPLNPYHRFFILKKFVGL